MECGGLDKNSLLIYRMTWEKWVNRINKDIKGIQYYQGKHGYTAYIGVYRVYSNTRVNMGTQDIQGYTWYTVLLG